MDRRRGELFWKALNLVVNLTFLLLAITIMTILLKNENYRADFKEYQASLMELREEWRRVSDANILYLEGKANRISENQDSYQLTTDRRVGLVEDRLKNLEQENKTLKLQNKSIINNLNYNNNIVNGEKR